MSFPELSCLLLLAIPGFVAACSDTCQVASASQTTVCERAPADDLTFFDSDKDPFRYGSNGP